MNETPDPLWYKDAIIYELHVKSFFDSNDDGIGDFPGLTAEARLPAGSRRHGDLAAAVLPVAAARRRLRHRRLPQRQSGLRHDARLPQLRARGARARPPGHHRAGHQPHLGPASLVPARAPAPSRASAYRNFYVWSDTDQKYAGTRIIFIDTETSNWTWDPVAKPYYWHRFFSHQPDLNFDNPRVVEAVIRDHALLARHGRRRAAARRHAVSVRARRHQQREPARDPRRHQADLRAAIDASYPRPHACSPRPTSGRRTCGPISATATSATWRSTSR